jgi:hypothetical protein
MKAHRRKLADPSLVISCMALVVALCGSGVAVAETLGVDTVGTAQVINRSLLAEDFKTGELPKGPKGPKGDKGSRGARGAEGEVGPEGSAGADGAPGAAGAPGATGTTGATGPTGLTGATGPTGPAGSLSSEYAYVYNRASTTVNPGVAVPFSNTGTMSSGMSYAAGELTISVPGTYEIQFGVTATTGGTAGIYVNGTLRDDSLIGIDHSVGLRTVTETDSGGDTVTVSGESFWDRLPARGQLILVVTGTTTTVSLRFPTTQFSNVSLGTTGGGAQDVNASLLVTRLG